MMIICFLQSWSFKKFEDFAVFANDFWGHLGQECFAKQRDALIGCCIGSGMGQIVCPKKICKFWSLGNPK